MTSTIRIILLAYITISLVSLIQGFPQELKLAVQPNPIISNGVYRQATDSYGNPVAYLEAAEAPDGRKFVHTGEGIQFEIPKYASGITEIKKPSDDLLPPLVPDDTNSSTDDENIFDQAATQKLTQVLQTGFIVETNKVSSNIRQDVQLQQKEQYPLKVQFNLEPLSQPNSFHVNNLKDVTGKSLREPVVVQQILTSNDNLKSNDHLSQLRDYFDANPDFVPISIVPSVELNISPLVAPPFSDTDAKSRVPRIEPGPIVKIDGEVYRGGFGGAPGILGEQKQIGWFYSKNGKDAPVPNNQKEIEIQNIKERVPEYPEKPVEEINNLNLNPFLPPNESSNNEYNIAVDVTKKEDINSETPNAENNIFPLSLDPLVPPKLDPIVTAIPNEVFPITTDSTNFRQPTESNLEDQQIYQSTSNYKNQQVNKITTPTPTTTPRLTTTRKQYENGKYSSTSARPFIQNNRNRKPQVISSFSISTVQGNNFPRNGFTQLSNRFSNKNTKIDLTTLKPPVLDTTTRKQIDETKTTQSPTSQVVSSNTDSRTYNQKLANSNNVETTTIKYSEESSYNLNLEPLLPPEVTQFDDNLNQEGQINNEEFQEKDLDKILPIFSIKQKQSTIEPQSNYNLDLNPFLPPKVEFGFVTDSVDVSSSTEEIPQKNIEKEKKEEIQKDESVHHKTDTNLVPNLSRSSVLQDKSNTNQYVLTTEQILPETTNKNIFSNRDNERNEKEIEKETTTIFPENISESQLELDLNPFLPPFEDQQFNVNSDISASQQRPESQLNSPSIISQSVEKDSETEVPFKSTNVDSQIKIDLNPFLPPKEDPRLNSELSNNTLTGINQYKPDLVAKPIFTFEKDENKNKNDLSLNIDPFVPPRVDSNFGVEGNFENVLTTLKTIQQYTTTTKTPNKFPITTTNNPKNERGTKYQNSPIINIKVDTTSVEPSDKEQNIAETTTKSPITTYTTTPETPTTEQSKYIFKNNSLTQFEHNIPNKIDNTETNSYTQIPASTKISTTTPSYNQRTQKTIAPVQQHSIFSSPNNIFTSTKKPGTIISNTLNSAFSSRFINNDPDQRTTSTTPSTTTTITTTTTTTTTNPTLSLLTNTISSTSKFFTAVPPSRLFTPPVFGRPEFSTASNDDVNKITEVITDLSKGSNPNTFSGAPTTSFAERLNFNKNVNQNIGTQGNNLLSTTESVITTSAILKQGVPTPNSITDIDNKPNIQLPNTDLAPPIISPINQFEQPSVEEQQPVNIGQKQVPFPNNPFLPKPTGTQQQILPSQPANAGGLLKNSASALNKNNNNNFNDKNYNNNKFTGTFGGAPGILGNQKPGYAVRPTVGSSSGNTITSNPIAKPIAVTPSVIITNPPIIGKPIVQNNPGKYTGGFGGPPGILAPFDNVQQRNVT